MAQKQATYADDHFRPGGSIKKQTKSKRVELRAGAAGTRSWVGSRGTKDVSRCRRRGRGTQKERDNSTCKSLDRRRGSQTLYSRIREKGREKKGDTKDPGRARVIIGVTSLSFRH